ncbi:MAG TPA: PPC domain-containing protein [Candidatus Paceibacterota bacterium]|nr:PPC domain-containing protein [Candidatus Paceibacterota bacterium]
MKKIFSILLVLGAVTSCEKLPELLPVVTGEFQTKNCLYGGELTEETEREAMRTEGVVYGTKYPLTRLLVKKGKINLVLSKKPAQTTTPLVNVVLLVDFNDFGDTVKNTSWNWAGPFYCPSPNLSVSEKDFILNRIKEIFARWGVLVTTDKEVFLRAPKNKRVRCIVTQNMGAVFSPSGGIAFPGQMDWGDEAPCFVFVDWLFRNIKNIAEAIAHEFGHAAGNEQHQSLYRADGTLQTQYNFGLIGGPINVRPVMGYGYGIGITTWWHGRSAAGYTVIQNDSLLSGGRFGERPDEPSLQTLGVGETIQAVIVTADEDTYKVVVSAGKTKIQVTSGGNTKLKVTVLNPAGGVVKIIDTPTGLDVPETVISNKNGTYYLRVEVSTTNLPLGTWDNRPIYGGQYWITIKN